VIDRLVRRDVRYRPFLPASTLKGITRQSCEKLSRTKGFSEPSDPHNPNLTQNQAFVPFSKIDSPVDRLFGTKFEPGGLFFRDARLPEDEPAETFDRSRAARYRVLKTAKDKHLFATEYSLPGSLFTRIDGWHQGLTSLDDEYPPYAYCLLIAGLLSVERIGGDKSTGSGWLEGPVRFKEIKYNGSTVEMNDVFEFLNPQEYLEVRDSA